MKFYSRSKTYKASNVTFNIHDLVATSYGWWEFLRVINGSLVFNEYRYSNTTARHQWKVRRLLEQHGIKIDLTIECPKGLQSNEWSESAIQCYKVKVQNLWDQVNKSGSHKTKNYERVTEISVMKEKIKAIESLSRKG